MASVSIKDGVSVRNAVKVGIAARLIIPLRSNNISFS